MIRIEQSIVINRPTEEVFEYVTQIENQSEWSTGVVEAEQTSQGPMSVGSTGRAVRRFLGRRIESTFEVTEYEPNKKFGFKSTSGPISMEGTQTFESVDGGTKFSFAFQGDPGGLFKVAEPILARMVKRQVEADFNNLKDLLEAQP